MQRLFVSVVASVLCFALIPLQSFSQDYIVQAQFQRSLPYEEEGTMIWYISPAGISLHVQSQTDGRQRMYRMIARPNSDELIFASRQGGGQPFAVRIDGQQFQASAALRGGELQRSGEAQQQQGRTCHPYQIQHPNAGQTQLCLARSIEVDWGRYPAFANGGAGISNLVTQGLQGFPLQIHTQKSGGQTLFKMTVQSVQATELQAGQVSLPEGTEILTEEEWRQQMKKSLQEQKQKEQEHQQK